MTKYIENFLIDMKPAFSYAPAFRWFVIVFAGFILRTDYFGVTSIIRALLIPAATYPNLLHFFHSTAWSTKTLMDCWIPWVMKHTISYRMNQRIVLIGDHTKIPKDGRKMPGITTLHQDSETASKPSFFRGHEWGIVALLTNTRSKFFATPLKAEIHNISEQNKNRITRTVEMAGKILESMNEKAYLVLDAYFAVGSTFTTAKQWDDKIHILTRAKKNVTAYIPAEKPTIPSRGRPRLYGPKLKLMDIFDSWKTMFFTENIRVYQNMEPVRYLHLDLMWKPTKSLIRFFFFETSRGRIILMTSDLNMTHTTALKLYCHRVTIEIMFDSLKNIFGGLKYHFWSRYLKSASRSPQKGKQAEQPSKNYLKSKQTQIAIEKFVAIQIVVLGFLQILAMKFPEAVSRKSLCWLRTNCSDVPSEFVTKMAVTNLLKGNLTGFGNDLISCFIRNKRKKPKYTGLERKVA